MGLSEPVDAAIDGAVQMIVSLTDKILNTDAMSEIREITFNKEGDRGKR